ncbi:hypothetical protein Pcinc_009012 [Petrolisthes cinctipes]|uniref:Uncharacterized protein n=1 Tax=Petrolisthes cinctipes TaxID=88211 RepID=A0AAE1G7P3_PETCI|nr:hypothetical protein Pcinc_009012 [Petrolisthes cinctipes]
MNNEGNRQTSGTAAGVSDSYESGWKWWCVCTGGGGPSTFSKGRQELLSGGGTRSERNDSEAEGYYGTGTGRGKKFFFRVPVTDASSNAADAETSANVTEQGSHEYMHGATNEAVWMRGESTGQGQRLNVRCFICANIEGLFPRRMKHKVEMLEEIAIETNAMVIALTESHLRIDILEAEIGMVEFQAYRADRSEGKKKGGVIVYVRRDIAARTRVISCGSNSVVEYVVLHVSSINLAIVTIYRPPTCKLAEFK